MPHVDQSLLRTPHRSVLFLVITACVSYLAWPGQPSSSAQTNSSNSQIAPGVISFASQNFSVNEGDGSSTLTLIRTGGSDGAANAKVTLADVTTSSADYLLSPGALDPTFVTPNSVTAGSASTYVFPSIALQPDGKLLVADSRTVWRLMPNGSLDPTFSVGETNNLVYTVTLQPDGKIIIGGGFTTFNNQRANRIARLNSDGTLDTSFDAGTGANEDVRVIALQADGKMLVAGLFNSFNGTSAGFVRLNSNGTVDTSYSYNQGFRYAIALQPDGKALVGGSGGIERINTDGMIDNTFHVNFTGSYPSINSIVLQPDGKILMAGGFERIDGQIVYSIARLNSDGSLDPTFSTGTGADIGVGTMALQPDGKLLIGGSFNSFNGTAAKCLLRLNSNGSIDPTFVHNITSVFGSMNVNNILLQPDGKVFIRGSLTVSGSNVTNRYLARLNNDLFVTWLAGDTANKTVNLPIVDDLLDEPDETLNLTLTPLTSGVSTGTFPGATLTITDNDVPPAITSALPPSFINISASYNHTFTATGSPASTFSITAGNLPPGIFLSPSGVLSGSPFSPGNYNNITVTASNGVAPAATQTFSIKVNSGPSSSTDSYSTIQNTTLTIAAPGVLANDVDPEGDSLTATLFTNPLHGTITLNSDGSFVYVPQANYSGTDFFNYRANDGNISGNTTLVFITVNSGGTLQFSSSAYTRNEDSGAAMITVNRFGGSAGEVRVDYSTSDGTATAGTDYTATTGTLVFAQGVTTQTFNVPLTADQVNEANETINLTLANVQGTGSLGSQNKAVLTITNDDAPRLQFSLASYTVVEGAGHLDLNVTRSGDPGLAVSVNYSTSDTAGLSNCNPQLSTTPGVASSRCDYATSVGTLRFAANETSRTIQLSIVDDVFIEGAESFFITLSSPAGGGVLGTNFRVPITITDNDTNGAVPNPIDSAAFMARQQYIDFLGREPDPAGYQAWQNILNNCPPSGRDANGNFCDRIEVSAGFFRSEEFQSRGYFIYRFYSAVGKIPSYNQFMPDFSKVSGFLSSQQLEDNKVAFVNEFMARSDFQNRYGATVNNPSGYVDALLVTLGLVNHPGRAGWIAGLTNATLTRAQVLRQVIESVEVYQKYYNEAFVIMQYFGYLRRDADISYLAWIQTMNDTGGDYRIMINGFLNSAEYRQRFGN
jgi:uncharacterized delta-60 repeat protein